MRMRRLGRTDLELTTIGMGTWAIGGPWEFGWGPQNDEDSMAAIRTAIESGINWIDTAPQGTARKARHRHQVRHTLER